MISGGAGDRGESAKWQPLSKMPLNSSVSGSRIACGRLRMGIVWLAWIATIVFLP